MKTECHDQRGRPPNDALTARRKNPEKETGEGNPVLGKAIVK